METRVSNSLSVAQPHKKAPQWLWPLLWGALLMMSVFAMSAAEPLFRWIEPDARQVIYDRAGFVTLLGRHLFVVGIAAVVTIIVGVAAGIAVTRRWGSDFLPLVAQLASLGQTFPPVAVLALAVPVLGFGTLPIIVALMLYGLLPIVRNTLAGLQGVEGDIKTAAHAMGIRTSVTINIATAALGATVGASNLGDPIISGIVNGNMAYVVQGALTIALLALTIDSLFEVLQRQLRARISDD